MSIGELGSRIWRIAKIIYATLFLTTIAGLAVLLLIFIGQLQQDLSQSLTITIIILVGAILIAASLATASMSSLPELAGKIRGLMARIWVRCLRDMSNGFRMSSAPSSSATA